MLRATTTGTHLFPPRLHLACSEYSLDQQSLVRTSSSSQLPSSTEHLTPCTSTQYLHCEMHLNSSFQIDWFHLYLDKTSNNNLPRCFFIARVYLSILSSMSSRGYSLRCDWFLDSWSCSHMLLPNQIIINKILAANIDYTYWVGWLTGEAVADWDKGTLPDVSSCTLATFNLNDLISFFTAFSQNVCSA